MSADNEVEQLLNDVEVTSPSDNSIALALDAVTTLLAAAEDSLLLICSEAEKASSRDALESVFKRFNTFMRMFYEAAPNPSHAKLVSEAVLTLPMGERFKALVFSSATLSEAASAYKRSLVQDLAAVLKRREKQVFLDDQNDGKLFAEFMPDKESAVAKVELSTEARKRTASEALDLGRIPKKSKIPALASFSAIADLCDDRGTSKKRVLLTREKLRAGMHDPRGLLNLVGPSTNALERTKRLELLKSAGLLFNDKRPKSFSDKLSAATLRLDTGMGGQAIDDTLLFGAKVLCTPGFLSPKNVSDVQNNAVEGKTTWTHQDGYAKMVIAGFLSQAKGIFSKYDEILWGESPEVAIGKAHGVIRDLLRSEEFGKFTADSVSDDDAASLRCDLLVKKIVEAVAPIIPISLRNKSLDAGYFRSALHLLGAGEFLFSQYVPDIRIKSNPSGLVGMANAVHAELKKAAMYNSVLKSPQEFNKDMRAQYQTFLGLGTPFPKDRMQSEKGQRRRSYARPFGRERRYRSSRGRLQNTAFAGPSGQDFSSPAGSTRGALRDSPTRSTAFCYDFQAGNCRRGASCRFMHNN